MRIGDILSLPVNPLAAEHRRIYADAKVMRIFEPCAGTQAFVLEFINGERDGFEFDLTRGELDKLLGREGGEDWKSQPEGGA